MRHRTMLGLCVVAALTFASLDAGSAFAWPQWGQKIGGTWYKGTEVEARRISNGQAGPMPFESYGTTSAVLETDLRVCELSGKLTGRVTRATCATSLGTEGFQGDVVVECEAEKDSGEWTGNNKLQNVQTRFTGCFMFGTIPCENSGTGEIQTNTVKGKLGWIHKPTEVGVLFEPTAGKNAPFARFTCAKGIYEMVVGRGNKKEGTYYEDGYPPQGSGIEKHGGYDGVISPITPVNTMTPKYQQVYTITGSPAEPQNLPTRLGKHIELLEDYLATLGPPEESTMWSPAGVEVTINNVPEEETEIKTCKTCG